MWLVLCSAEDLSALWAYQGLQARGLLPLELVTTEMLPHSLKWEHRLEESGTSTSITLADGRVINNRAVRGVLNRLAHVPLQHLAGAPDYDYAIQEYNAFFMSWLYALPQPILNSADAQGLCGAWRHISEWVCLAAQAGLATPYYKQTSHDQFDESKEARRLFPAGTSTVTSIVVGDRVVGPALPREIQLGCLRLARLSQTPLLGIDLTNGRSANDWSFAGATPMPDLRMGGEPLLDALFAELYQPERSRTP
jgi:hypothetical protein